MNHNTCSHSPTSSARRSCRKVQDAVALAHALGLRVEVHTEEWVQEYRFKVQDEQWHDTWVQVVVSTHGNTRMYVFQPTKIHKVGINHLQGWLSLIAR